MKFEIKSLAFAVFLSFIILTVLNLLLSQVFEQIPVLKTGKALILILTSITLTMLFVFVQDKHFDKSEIFMFILILGVMIGIFYITKEYIPEMYSLFPNSLKEISTGILG